VSAGIDNRRRILAGQPGTERRITVNGNATAVFETGSGPPLVLLHGGIESGGPYWAPVVAPLTDHFRIVIPDAPGLGESAPVERLNAETFAGWFADLLRVTGVSKPVVVAHSLFGSLAASYATGHSDDLRRLIIYGAPGIGRYRMPLRLRYVAIRFALRPTAGNAERFDRFALLDFDATRARDPEWWAAFDAYTRSRASVPHVKRTMRQLIGAGTRRIPDEPLRQIAVPVNLIWGQHDRMVPLNLAEEASRRLAWPLHVVPGAAHAPHIEQPDAFVHTLCTILNTSNRTNPYRQETTS
jgi:pimeloyl-ACP methyl ester carboxylesterase